jgi:hypothetical protein
MTPGWVWFVTGFFHGAFALSIVWTVIMRAAVNAAGRCTRIGPTGRRCTKPASHVLTEPMPCHDERPRTVFH